MKKLLFSIFLFIGLIQANCQDNAGIYYEGGLLPHSRITGQKLGNLVGAYVTGGLSGAKRNLQIEGKTSDLIIKEKKPEFTIKFDKEFKKYNGMFSDDSNLEYLVLVKLKSSSKNRKMQNGSYGLTGVESTLSEKHVVPLGIDENEDGSFTIIPDEELKPGEYAFWFTLPIPEKEQSEDGETTKEKSKPFNTVFDFTIKK